MEEDTHPDVSPCVIGRRRGRTREQVTREYTVCMIGLLAYAVVTDTHNKVEGKTAADQHLDRWTWGQNEKTQAAFVHGCPGVL